MNLFESQNTEFQRRHIGPDEQQTAEMLKAIGVATLEELVDRTVPAVSG
jgi:glycine dehydrogenase